MFTENPIFTVFVNIAIIVNMGTRESVGWVLRYLKRITPVQIDRIDDTSDIALSVNSGHRPLRFSVRSYASLSQENASSLVGTSKSKPQKPHLLIAVRELAPRTREFLREHCVSWIEHDTGVCHLVGPGLFVDTKLSVPPPAKTIGVPTRLKDRTGLVAEALLTAPISEPIRVSSVSKRAGTSTALVSRVLQRLTGLKLLQEHGAGPHRSWSFLDYGGLLELWSAEERKPDTISNLYVWSRSPGALYEKLAHVTHELKAQWALAGTAAAYLYAPILTAPPNPIVRLDSTVPAEELAKLLGGDVVESGANLHVWQNRGNLALHEISPWTPPKGELGDVRKGGLLQVVSRPRAYIETVNTPGRGPEVAQALRDTLIKDRHARE